MPPAIIAAGVVAAGTIGGAVLSSGAQKSAANQASSAELQATQENNALATQFRQENQANFQPFLNSGTRSNSLIDSFLYGPGPTDYHTGQMPAQAPAQPGVQTAPVASQTPVAGLPPAMGGGSGILNAGRQAFAQRNALMGGEPMGLPTVGPQALGAQTAAGAGGAHLGGLPGTTQQMAGTGGGGAPSGAVGGTPQPQGGASPFSGYAAFINSPYYQFGQQEGMRALNGGLASQGLLESGDAMKSAIRFGQDYGYSQGLMPYLGLAGDQTNRGVQSAGAIAGVGVNALNSMSANNTNAGNALANAALARGTANANMFSGIGSALGGLAGSAFGGSSYGAPAGGGGIVSNYHYTGSFG